jgi:glycosyltransferase involved in cell wall biosynthesis
MMRKLNILFEGWTNIAHSYAIVNCFQLLHLWKNYKDHINFYVDEKEYYRQEWNSKKQLVYSKEENELLSNKEIFKPIDSSQLQDIDVIYRITYPYDVTMSEWNRNKPVCVFYTSEFSKLDTNYFKIGIPPNTQLDDTYIKTYLNHFKNISFTSPSLWSSLGMKKYINEPDNEHTQRNIVISHGVDTKVFYKESESLRQSIRKHYNIKDDDIMLLNMGAMTKNKGIMYIIQIMNILVNKLNKKHFKLLLKGTSDLYETKQFLESYFEELQKENIITKDEMNYLLENNIIFTEKTLNFKQIRYLYNAADLYISPYIAEGFNLCCLEALACGLNVLVPKTGSTKEYMEDIFNNGGEKTIHYVNSEVTTLGDNMKINNIDGNHLLSVCLEFEKKYKEKHDQSQMFEFINKQYSWDAISHQLYSHLYSLAKQKGNV